MKQQVTAQVDLQKVGKSYGTSEYSPAAVQDGRHHFSGAFLDHSLGVILLIMGFVTKVAIIWTIGIIVVVVGAILALLGMAGHTVGRRGHYF